MVRTATIAARIARLARSTIAAVALTATAAAIAEPARDEPRASSGAAELQALGDAYRAYDAGDLATARAKLAQLDAGSQGASRVPGTPDNLDTRRERADSGAPGQPAGAPAGAALDPIADYVLWLRGMVALRSGEPARAERAFRQLARLALPTRSPFSRELPWRLADCAWDQGNRTAAAAAYERALADKGARAVGDVGTAMYRIAETRRGAAAVAQYRALVLGHPGHPLASRAEHKLAELGAPPLTGAERIERARRLTDAHLWDEAVDELSTLDTSGSPELARQRDYWLGTTLYKMRRRYGDAGKLLLGVYRQMGGSAAEAMFHGARALSRADRDDEAIRWYRKVVAEYPSTVYAQEAQFLSGWLEFNRGRYQDAIAPLETALSRYPRSKWASDARWFLAMSHYFLGRFDQARTQLDELAGRTGALEAGKGSYWLARIADRQRDKPAAIAGYTQTVTRFPFSWYALLSRARLKALGVELGPFGERSQPRGPKLAATVDEALAKDPVIRRADQLIAAGLRVEAGDELARSERAFLGRHDRGAAFAMLLDRYRKAGNFNRPWMLAVVYSGGALSGPPEGDARRWWENAYPRAYRELVEKYQGQGGNPEGYLYGIMRIESGFNPHDLSYADAQGLLQMIPPTTLRVARELKIPYDPGRLYEPEYNIQTASWYIGHLLKKFKGQVPIGAGSYNSGPRPVMRWVDLHGDREIDELVELVPYTQTREYMKKATENFARYQYLYQGKVYEQPLTVDKRYLDDRLTY